MRVSQLMTRLESLNLETEAACERHDTAAAERDAGEFAALAMSRMRGHRPAAFRPTAGGSIRMSAAEVDAAMDDDADFDATVDGIATLPVVLAKAVLSAAGLMPEVDDEDHAASDRRSVSTSPILSGVVSYLRALPEAKRQLLMSELSQQWNDAQAAAMAARVAEEAARAGRYV